MVVKRSRPGRKGGSAFPFLTFASSLLLGWLRGRRRGVRRFVLFLFFVDWPLSTSDWFFWLWVPCTGPSSGCAGALTSLSQESRLLIAREVRPSRHGTEYLKFEGNLLGPCGPANALSRRFLLLCGYGGGLEYLQGVRRVASKPPRILAG